MNLQNKRKETSLLMTAFWSVLENIEMLLQFGADINFESHIINKVYELKVEDSLEMNIIIPRHIIKMRNMNLADDSVF